MQISDLFCNGVPQSSCTREEKELACICPKTCCEQSCITSGMAYVCTTDLFLCNIRITIKNLVCEKSVVTTELHYSKKKWRHYVDILCLKNGANFSCCNLLSQFYLCSCPSIC